MRLRHLCLLATVSILPFGLTPGALAQSGAALTGVVSSQEEGNMEGVLVNAKKEGSTITVTVVTDDRAITASRPTGSRLANTRSRSAPPATRWSDQRPQR